VQFIKKLALIEAEGVGFYRSLAEHADDERIKKLSRMMARAEESHRQGFEELAHLLERRKKSAPSSKISADLRQYILALIDHRIFLSPEQAATLAKNVENLDEAVNVAIKFEKENILLLQECREISGGNTKKLLDTIIGQERKHIVGLQKAKQKLSRGA
jgi:rubrerythrin